MRYGFMKVVFGLVILFSTLQLQAQNDSLDNYVQRLKLSKAAGGSETAFMSIGSDFLYAQEYFEAGNFSSAAYSFEAILRKEKDHPYATYQLAVALLKQKDPYKTQYANTLLANAFKLQPNLRQRYDKEFSQEKNGQGKITPVANQPTNQQTQAPADATGLDEFIQQIKYARSTGGVLTAMLSAGLDAFYGIEYYEVGDYRSAETNFGLSLAKDPANPFVNYLQAVSLAAQGKSNEAKPFFEKAVAAVPALQQRFNQDVSTANKIWKEKEDAKVIKTSPAAPVKYGGKLVYGNYTCHVSVWNGPNISPAYRQDYKGYFALKKDGTYRWLDDGVTGRFSYDAKTGTVTWLSGEFKTSLKKIGKFKTDGKYATITIEMAENYKWNCGCKL